MFKWFKNNNEIKDISSQENSETEKVSLQENTEQFIDDFSKLVKDGNQTTINRFIKFMANSVQGELISKCLYNDRNYSNYTNYILYSLVLDLPMEELPKCSCTVKVTETPIISCIWKCESIFCNLRTIGICNNHPFDGIANSINITSYLINPLGLVIVNSGNHSVNSAIVHNEGEIKPNNTIDISPVLEKYRFDGENYVDIGTNEKIYNTSLKNNSEPFTYTLGLLFEMARVLKEKRN